MIGEPLVQVAFWAARAAARALALLSKMPPPSIAGMKSARLPGLSRVFMPAPLIALIGSTPAPTTHQCIFFDWHIRN